MKLSFPHLRPFSGGPLFDRLNTLCFDLEGTQLEFTTPGAIGVWEDPPRMLNLPFKKTGWFESHCKQRLHHVHVHLHTELWYYLPVRLNRLINLFSMGENPPMGHLAFVVHLRKLKNGKTLDQSTPSALGDYIRWEYEDHYESPEIGSGNKGRNFESRQRNGKTLAEKGPTYQSQYEAALRQELQPIPTHFELMDFGGGRWTHYALNPIGYGPPTQFYCIPLSESYYLHIEIEPTIHSVHEPKIGPNMLSTTRWLVDHIKISFPNRVPTLPAP